MLLISEQQSTYPLALLLSSTGKKTCEALGRAIGKSGDTIIRLLKFEHETSDQLIEFTKLVFQDKDIYLIIDDVLIEKMYSKLIEGTSDNRDHSTGAVYRSLCSVAAMLSDGKCGIAVSHELWTSREAAQEGYKSKTQLAQELIEGITRKIKVKAVIMDGLYATEKLIKWMYQANICFEMRFHSNRVIKCDSGESFNIRNCPGLQLKGKKSSVTISAYWKKIPLFFTAVKRKSKDGYAILFQASNYLTSSVNHKLLYSYRWNIEMFFRTAKQHLGLNECQSRKLNLQKNHITNVFLAYALLQAKRIKQKLPNPETALRRIKQAIASIPMPPLLGIDQIFHQFKAYYA